MHIRYCVGIQSIHLCCIIFQFCHFITFLLITSCQSFTESQQFTRSGDPTWQSKLLWDLTSLGRNSRCAKFFYLCGLKCSCSAASFKCLLTWQCVNFYSYALILIEFQINLKLTLILFSLSGQDRTPTFLQFLLGLLGSIANQLAELSKPSYVSTEIFYTFSLRLQPCS